MIVLVQLRIKMSNAKIWRRQFGADPYINR